MTTTHRVRRCATEHSWTATCACGWAIWSPDRGRRDDDVNTHLTGQTATPKEPSP